ncbi:MAG: CTP synthase [Candidatus Heimdallarchaeota archaeon LC_3]|nr:MAG: CTP synthase [Candidatus Heimdallarchaeota archaeon LC_3]
MQGINARLKDLKSDESEFLDFFPENYTKGNYHYIFITGGVYSSVGKGIFAGALGHLLQSYGFNVTIIKMEGYLNIDSGTINPFRHGEVFVLEDGTESDLDLGNYERYLNKNLTQDNFITAGKIYSRVLEKERQGEYLGRDVLVIPHLTGEIKNAWRRKAQSMSTSSQTIVLLEIGGTVGDYENLIFIEAARQMKLEEGEENVLFFHVTPILYNDKSEEFKTKPSQHSVRALMELGIQPNFVVCRTKEQLPTRVKEKVSLYCNIPMERVLESPDVISTYLIPSILNKQNIIRLLETKLKFPYRSYTDQIIDSFETYAKSLLTIKNEGHKITIIIAGKYVNNVDSYLSIAHSLEHAGVANNVTVRIKYIDTEAVESSNTENFGKLLSRADGIIVPGGFGKRGLEGKIKVVKYARENKIPYLGLCLGFQVALIEFARNVCGINKAQTTESNPNTPEPVIYLLPTQANIDQIGGSMRLGAHKVKLHPFSTSKVMELYLKDEILERFRHRYEFNKKYQEIFEKEGIHFVGKTPDGKINQIFELDQNIHPYYIGTQFHPEFLSRPKNPHPLFFGLVKAAIERENKQQED